MDMNMTSLSELPQRLHHQAFCVRDQERNRQFIEGVLGIPLSATWCERVFRPEVGREVDYCHTFYELADGGALAFFWFKDGPAAAPGVASAAHLPGAGDISSAHGSMNHVAINVPAEKVDAYYDMLLARGVKATRHGPRTCPRIS